MKENNNPNQWKNTNPPTSQIIEDIKNEDSYVCLEQDEIVGVFFFKVHIDPTYLVINGKWLNDEEYGVIHRIASKYNKKGIASFIINWCKQKTNNIRIDTHHDNLPMQNLLLKHNFKYCGIIKLLNGENRIAYQFSTYDK